MKSTLLLLPILWLLGGELPAQSDHQFPVRIDSVLIVGNHKTRDQVILREIPFTFPAALKSDDFQLIQNRLTNLFLFNRVEMLVIPDGRRNLLLIQVTEFLYIYPVPILFINERDWEKVSYGFQLSHINFRGMHEFLSAGGWLGYNPSFFLNYHSPWVGRKSRLIVGFDFFGKKIGNKFFDFDEGHLGGRITIGKRLNLNRSIEASLTVRRIRFPEEFKYLSVSGSGTDVVPKMGVQFTDEHRDLIEYARHGYFLQWTVRRVGWNSRQPEFWRFIFDHRAYFELHNRVSIGARNLLNINRGELPIYDRIFIGFFERIRGYFNRRFTAQNLMLQNYEVRISLLPIHYLSWKDAPLFPSFFQNLKYGLSLGLFVDSGIVWNRRNEFSRQNHFTGYGAGLHIHLPYVLVLRIDRAWNDRGDGEWIIEAGASF